MDIQLLEKFLKGECDEQQAEKVLNWIGKQAQSKEVDVLFRQVWSDSENKRRLTQSESKLLKHAILNKIKKFDLPGYKHELTRQKVRNINQSPALKIASIVILIAVAGAVLFFTSTVRKTKEPSVTEVVIKENPAGIKRSYLLRDSSHVFLNSASKIFYPNQFSSDKREIFLEGEAYFEVKENTKKPFVVLTENLKTTALGTAFNICSYDDNQKIVISLTKGKVKVENLSIPGEQFFLHPGEQLVYFKNTGETHKKDFSEKNTLAWMNGTICFKNASLSTIIKKLERWYGLRFEIIRGRLEQGDNWNYSGTFTRESLDNVLKGIGYVKEFDFKIEDKVVKLKLK